MITGSGLWYQLPGFLFLQRLCSSIIFALAFGSSGPAHSLASFINNPFFFNFFSVFCSSNAIIRSQYSRCPAIVKLDRNVSHAAFSHSTITRVWKPASAVPISKPPQPEKRDIQVRGFVSGRKYANSPKSKRPQYCVFFVSNFFNGFKV